MFIKGKNFKYVAAGGDLAAADALKIAEEGVSLKVDPEILDIITSEGPAPYERYSLGDKTELKAVVVGASLDDIRATLGLSGAGTAIAGGNETRVFGKHDFEFETELVVGGTKTAKIVSGTNFFMTPALDLAFKAKEMWHLPITMTGADDHTVNITDAA